MFLLTYLSFIYTLFMFRGFLAKGHHGSTCCAVVVSDRAEDQSYMCICGLTRGRGLTGGSLVVVLERSGGRVCWTHRTTQPARLG